MDSTKVRNATDQGSRQRSQGSGKAHGDRCLISRATRRHAPKSHNLAVLHPDTDLMSEIRDALCPTLFPSEGIVCPRTAQGVHARASLHHMNVGTFASVQGRVKKSRIHPVHREVKQSFAPGKFLYPPRNIGAFSNSTQTQDAEILDANELDVLEQTLHGEGAIVRKYPPPESTVFQNLDDLHRVVEEPDRFFVDFMGQGADPPAELEEMENTTGDSMETCADPVLLKTDMAPFEVSQQSPRRQLANYALPLGPECNLLGKHASSKTRPILSTRTVPPYDNTISPETLRNIDGTIGNQGDDTFRLAEFPLGEATIHNCKGETNANHNSFGSASLADAFKCESTVLDSPVNIQDFEQPVEDVIMNETVSAKGNQKHSYPPVYPNHSIGNGMLPGYTVSDPRPHQPEAHQTIPKHRQDDALARRGKHVRDFAESPTAISSRGLQENWDQLPVDTQKAITKLRAKIAMMPRRKLRECLASGITLDEIVPLMEVNRDDLASMLGLGVTTWKSFLHNELRVPRWPARALKSIANKTIEAQGRRDAALRDGEEANEAVAIAEMEKLAHQRTELMQQLRADAAALQNATEVEPPVKRSRPVS